MSRQYRTESGEKIWKAYNLFQQTGHVNRAGGRLTCCYGPDVEVEAFSDIAIDTVQIHSANIAFLLTQISMHYPALIRPEELVDYIQLAFAHDYGEVNNGDQPDDGTRDNATYDKLERKSTVKFLHDTLPSNKAAHHTNRYDEAKDRNSLFGKIFYLLGDKMDGAFRILHAEASGYKPSVLNKFLKYGKNPDQLVDVQSTLYTQTTSPYDNFIHSELIHQEIFTYPYFLLEVYFELVQSAAYAVRQTEMRWLEPELNRLMYCFNRNLPIDGDPFPDNAASGVLVL